MRRLIIWSSEGSPIHIVENGQETAWEGPIEVVANGDCRVRLFEGGPAADSIFPIGFGAEEPPKTTLAPLRNGDGILIDGELAFF